MIDSRARMAAVNEIYALEARRPGLLRARAAGSPYIFSGLLKCSLCGASITIVSGCSGKRQDVRYGCSLHYNRGCGACSNSLLVSRRILEEQLLTGLREKVLQPHAVEYTLARFEAELKRAFATRHSETEAYRSRESELERKIGNLTRALADGYSQAITTELTRTEVELERIRIHASCPGTLAEQMRNTRKFVKSRLRDLRALFSAEAVTMRAEIAKHVQKIVLTPEGRAYIASGSWNLLSWQHGWCRGPGLDVTAER